MLSLGIRWLAICARTVFRLTARALRSIGRAFTTADAMFLTLRYSPAECVLLAVAFLGTVLTILQVWLLPGFVFLQTTNDNAKIDAPIVLWWATSFGEDDHYRKCGDKRCYFTKQRSNAVHPLLRAILFYASNFDVGDLPIPRNRDVRWALLHEESPRNNPMFVHEATLKLFNYSATFSRYSDVPLTVEALPGEKELTSKKYFRSLEEKNKLQETEKLGPVLYIQSDCDTASDRDSYVAELMKHIQVDSYGACLNNRRLPKRLTDNYIEKLDDEELFNFVARYKFTLAFENAVCDDYITEKLWRPLMVGSVPIYYGSPTFEDWLPNENSAISAEKFPEPKYLADFLLELNNDDRRYNEYLAHKLTAEISNERLLNALRSRPENLFSIFGYYLREFECLVCERIHDTGITTMTTKQYNCPLPKNILSDKKIDGNEWVYNWRLKKCSSKLLNRHVEEGTAIDIDRFEDETFAMYERNDCS